MNWAAEEARSIRMLQVAVALGVFAWAVLIAGIAYYAYLGGRFPPASDGESAGAAFTWGAAYVFGFCPALIGVVLALSVSKKSLPYDCVSLRWRAVLISAAFLLSPLLLIAASTISGATA